MGCVSTIDWAGTGAMLQGVGTIIGAGAVLIAAKLGANTFESWREQKLAERRIEQAERILTATYKVRRGLSMVRSPAMWGGEINAAEDQLKQSGIWEQTFPESRRNSLATKQAYYNRISATRDDQRALAECQPMARALFGEDLERALEKLIQQFWTVQVYVDANYSDRGIGDEEFRRKIDSSIYEGIPSPDQNEVDQIIAAQVKLIEDACVPTLRLEAPKLKKG